MRVFHVSAEADRASIARQGLLPRRPGQARSHAEQHGNPPGVYFFVGTPPPMNADCWHADLDGLTVHPDPQYPDIAVYVTGPVPASRLTLTYAAGDAADPFAAAARQREDTVTS